MRGLGLTPLYIACQNGHESTARLLLDKGASIDLADEDGTTPLFMASQEGHEAVVQLLLERAIAYLLQDVRIASLVNLEGFVAVGTDDFVHSHTPFF